MVQNFLRYLCYKLNFFIVTSTLATVAVIVVLAGWQVL